MTIMMSKAKMMALAATPMITGSISFAASLTIIISILRSDVKLSTSYRRLIFGISVCDLIQSISQAFSSVPMPVGTYSLASGNDITCAIQSFMLLVGFGGTIFYTLSLSIYFLLVVKYKVDDANITKYAEPFLHAIPIIFSLIFPISILTTKNYNTDDQLAFCTIHSRPLNCHSDPNVECISKGNIKTLAWVLSGSFVLTFALNCIMMGMIWLEVRFQTKQSEGYRYSWMVSTKSSAPGAVCPDQVQGDGNTTSATISTSCATFCKSCFGGTFSSLLFTFFTKNQEAEQSSSALATRLSRPSQASVRRLKETSRRAIGYAVGFLLTYTFFFIQRMIMAFRSDPAPFTIIFLAKFFFPLQGLFNVLVYTYPHVLSYRRNHSEYSWIRAFWEVVKSGGDSDRIQLSSGRRRSLGKQKKALAIENSKKKEKQKLGRRNSSSGGSAVLTPPSLPFDAAQLVSPTIELPEQREELSYIDLNDTKNLSPTNDYNACEEGYGEETIIRDDIQEQQEHNRSNNDLFPIASSKLMKSDSSNWVISSSSRNDDNDDGSFNG